MILNHLENSLFPYCRPVNRRLYSPFNAHPTLYIAYKSRYILYNS
jgi:hypothetical protein